MRDKTLSETSRCARSSRVTSASGQHRGARLVLGDEIEVCDMNKDTRALLYDCLILLRSPAIQWDLGSTSGPYCCNACHEAAPWHAEDCELVALRARLEVALGLTREGGTA